MQAYTYIEIYGRLYGILARTIYRDLEDTAVKLLSMRARIVDCIVRFEKAVRTAASCCELEAKFSLYFNEVHRR